MCLLVKFSILVLRALLLLLLLLLLIEIHVECKSFFLLVVIYSDVSFSEIVIGKYGLVNTACQRSVVKSKYHTIHSYANDDYNVVVVVVVYGINISVVNNSCVPSPLPINTNIFLS